MSTSSADIVLIDAEGESLSEEQLQALIHEHVQGQSLDVDVEHGGNHEVIIIKKKVITIEDDSNN